jgi:hypothetical protein
MDFQGHVDYVKFIVDRASAAARQRRLGDVPVAALLPALRGIARLFGGWNGLVIRLFWLISIASALAQIEIAYRLARRVFPDARTSRRSRSR